MVKYMNLMILSCMRIILIWFCLCGCTNSNNKTDFNSLSSKDAILKVFISESRIITIQSDTIGYCNLTNELNTYLREDTINRKYIKIFPDTSLDMAFVECIVRAIKKTSFDTIGFASPINDFVYKEYNDEKAVRSSEIFVHILDEQSAMVNADTLAYNLLRDAVNMEVIGEKAVVIRYSMTEGLSYSSMLSTDSIINSIKESFKGEVEIDVDLHNCPYCVSMR